MSEFIQPPHPLLIVVTGRPGAGKTSLAHTLARAIRCPLLCRDEVKEGFLNTVGTDPDDAGRIVYETFFDAMELLLTRRITLVAEAAFQHRLWASKLESLGEIARVRIIFCTVEPELARARRIERSRSDPNRERFHSDELAQADRKGRILPTRDYDPPHLDLPMLTVDTSDGYQPGFEAIVSFSCA